MYSRQVHQKIAVSDMFFLPEDILIEILLRSSVKSLFRWRSVSKYLYGLITSHDFMMKHAEYARRNSSRIVYSSCSILGTLTLHSADYDNLNAPTLTWKLQIPRKLFIVGSCNGIVCLSDYKSFFALCNPATREYKQVSFDLREEVTYFNLGFCHDLVTNKYTVLRLDFCYGQIYDIEHCDAYVYTLGNKEWRKINMHVRVSKHEQKIPYLHGAFHWFRLKDTCTWNGYTQQVERVIIAFDVGTEKFETMPATPRPRMNKGTTLGVLQGCLSQFSFSVKEKFFLEIWLMKEYKVDESWSKVYSISFEELCEPFVVRKDEKILLRPTSVKNTTKQTRIPIYDPISNEVGYSNCGIKNWTFVDSYVETLVSVSAIFGEQAIEEENKNMTGALSRLRFLFGFYFS